MIEKEIENAYKSGQDTFSEEMVQALDKKGVKVPNKKLPVYPTSLPKAEREEVIKNVNVQDRTVYIKPDEHIEEVKGDIKIVNDNELSDSKGIQENKPQAVEFKIEVRPPSDDDFFQVNENKLKALQDQLKSNMGRARYGAIKKMGADYQDILKQVDFEMQTGSISLYQAIDKATKKIADTGLNCVEYANGTRVNISTYVELVLRTSERRSVLEAEGTKRREWGIYTVVSPTLHSTCPTCQIWQGMVLFDDVFSGATPTSENRYPLLSLAMSGDSHFLGVNCRHPLVTYIDGVTQIPTKSPYDKTKNNYKTEQRQRTIERHIRKYKRRKALAVTDEEEKKANKKIREWQAQMRAFLKENPQRKRNPNREKVS